MKQQWEEMQSRKAVPLQLMVVLKSAYLVPAPKDESRSSEWALETSNSRRGRLSRRDGMSLSWILIRAAQISLWIFVMAVFIGKTGFRLERSLTAIFISMG